MKKIEVRLLFLAGLFLNLAGCASHLPGTQAQEVSTEPTKDAPRLQISMDDLGGASSQHYRAFVVSLMNNSDRWIHLDSVNVKFPTLTEQPTFLLGQDLATYMEAVSRRNSIEGHNRNLLWASLAVAGTAGGLATRNQDAALAGMGLATAAVTAASVESVLTSAKKSEFHQALPDNHILKPFSIPPGLSMSRWVVVSLKEGRLFEEMALDLKERDGSQKTYIVADRRHDRIQAAEGEKRLRSKLIRQ